MIADKIYLWGILIFYLVFIIWYWMINDKEKGIYFIGDYGNKVKANHIWRFAFFLAFSILSFIFAFLELQMNFTKIVAALFSTVSLGIFFYDIFIKNVKQEEYVAKLQNQALKEVQIEEVFILEEDKADYNLSGNDDTMMVKVIRGREGLALSLRMKDKNLVFTPKCEMTEKEIDFFCKQLNFYWTENRAIPETIKIFEDNNLYNYDKQYIWHYSPRFKPEAMAKIKKVLKIVGIIAGVLFVGFWCVLSLIESSENEFLQFIANAVSDWLFGGN
ncbi:MAG: hypothetical protein IKB98_06460 [Clostridia bacterium]|nr:hypothetical protein [Clostridia bacterium]